MGTVIARGQVAGEDCDDCLQDANLRRGGCDRTPRRMPTYLPNSPPIGPARPWPRLGLERPRCTSTFWLCLLLLIFGQPLCAADSSAGTTNTDAAPLTTLHPRLGVGSWIWDRTTHDHQECRLWKSFEIPMSATVEKARLRITVDNEYRLFLDGRELGHGAELGTLTAYDVTPLLAPGVHVLGVAAYNDLDIAGVLLGLRIELTDGRVIEVGSDETWRSSRKAPEVG